MFLPIIVSATRPDSSGLKVGKSIENLLKAKFPSLTTKLVTPNDFKIDFDSEDHKDPNYSELTKQADAFILVISEYNHGYPGRFKTLIDSEFSNYDGKNALLVGVSSGIFGGARALENILPVLRAVNIKVTRKDILFPQAHLLVDSEGNYLDKEKEDKVLKTLHEYIDSLGS